MRQKFFYLTLLVSMLIFSPVISSAQEGDEIVNLDPPPPPTLPVDTPIDGGLTLLITAGVGYGIKKVRDSRKQRTHSID